MNNLVKILVFACNFANSSIYFYSESYFYSSLDQWSQLGACKCGPSTLSLQPSVRTRSRPGPDLLRDTQLHMTAPCRNPGRGPSLPKSWSGNSLWTKILLSFCSQRNWRNQQNQHGTSRTIRTDTEPSEPTRNQQNQQNQLSVWRENLLFLTFHALLFAAAGWAGKPSQTVGWRSFLPPHLTCC